MKRRFATLPEHTGSVTMVASIASIRSDGPVGLLFESVSQRAKWIESEADALVGEHGKDAYRVACDMERRSGELSAKLLWYGVEEAILSRRTENGMDLLSPVRASYCISCLAEEIPGLNLKARADCLRSVASNERRHDLNLEGEGSSKRAVWPARPAHDPLLDDRFCAG